MRTPFLVLVLLGCGSTPAAPDGGGPSVDAASRDAAPALRDAGAEPDAERDGEPDAGPPPEGPHFAATRIGDHVQWRESHPVPCYLMNSVACTALATTGGVTVGDVNDDGWPDAVFARMDAPDLLYLNDGAGRFSLPPREIDPTPWLSNGVALADFDADDDLDLAVGTVGDDQLLLYVNDGEGRFEERARARGAALDDGTLHATMSLCAGDANGDGFLDLHATEWRPHESDRHTSRNALLLNRGESARGFFRDSTEEWGLSMVDVERAGAWGFTSHLADLNADDQVDLWVTADFGCSRLFWGTDEARCEDMTDHAGVGTDENGMGSTLGDFDGDGDLDAFVSAIYDDDCGEPCYWGTSGNRLYRNEGGGRFTDVTDAWGVRDGGWGWGTAFFDYDLDGDLDLVLVNGVEWTREETGFHEDPVRLWRNEGDRFVEVAWELGLRDRGIGRAVVPADVDRDGDLDLILTHARGPAILWRNEAAEGRSWLVVEPRGAWPNLGAWGATVRVQAREGGPWQTRMVGNGCHFLGHTPGTPHFGLGDAETVARVEVRWPSGATTTLEDVPARQHLEFEEPAE
ncbi:MAG TPA: CRTAC1 family protein [Polyangiaceae bacterium LLY-WYZ-15_(1-7)]|nr:hypothetical protein [Myxococcales bacterium]MAT27564.1 hypothetical protein [Sandaracinus sp.]HJK94367.1 CRTAC1 family protein [Polyangiaceae bacterium LLY-WYZ-15_(1-7)]MBJ74124.1 hypothetical protein [Sandaracinus sp.]HJL06378.1 CRTAC1 family protein [Polyangiaceae bacterium LLY-WYZ-15_(1-7)]